MKRWDQQVITAEEALLLGVGLTLIALGHILSRNGGGRP